jgi:asparagine synthase (glutamine-hydrolysing)
MDFVALISGGKDSLFAAYHMVSQGWSLRAFLTVKPAETESFMFHTINLGIVRYQAEAAGLPLLELRAAAGKEAEVEGFTAGLAALSKSHGFDAVVNGGVSSEYQRRRMDRACSDSGLKSFSPLWHVDPVKLLNNYLDCGFKFIMSGVYAMGLDSSWLGHVISANDVERLARLNSRYGVSVVGEGGEYESAVLDCPLFRNALRLKGSVSPGLNRSEFRVSSILLASKSSEPLVTIEPPQF